MQEFLPGSIWKDLLMRGEVNLDTARALGRTLARIHAANPSGLEGRERLRSLRLAPYFEAAAAARPEFAGPLKEIVERLDAPGDRLVHGDFSPKNLLIDDTGTGVRVIDWEVVHAGDPAFDLAFLVTHLAGKAIRRPDWADRYGCAATAFDQSYGPFDRPWRDRLVGALLIARADGKSPLEYLDNAGRARLREIGSNLLKGMQTWPW
ncbi:phosphotransferase family protein [Micromonospora echinofusca]|uniref:Phosphotransferase n=1 Tax=Micromonospora echinofusca TaxID=47858 RepID=A0ABS3VVF1_MICEH|nr:phosphotransferase [Micromonospora echinofusca]MBO4208527.1 phosphotransferase [Micromonospora echinofusca]